MQPQEQSSPPEEYEPIQYYSLEGLFPATHVFALNLALGTFIHLYQHAQVPYPLVLGEQQLTERERDLLRPLLATSPQFTPYEVIHASFHEGYDRLSEHLITQAQARLDLLRLAQFLKNWYASTQQLCRTQKCKGRSINAGPCLKQRSRSIC